MYNYWNYSRYLVTFLKRLLKGKNKGYKIYRSKPTDDKLVRFYEINSKADFIFARENFQILCYRVNWKDGTKSRMFFPGINDLITNTTESYLTLFEKGTHTGEAWCKV